MLRKLQKLYNNFKALWIKKADVDYKKIPSHIAIIMDGNGRWAKSHGLDRRGGHAAGAQTLEDIANFCEEIGVKTLTVYAFSTENWVRPKEEVDALMDLLYNYLADAEKSLKGRNIIVRVIGDVSQLSEKIQKQIEYVENSTKDKTGMILNLAVNYGGRDEIIMATKKIANDVLTGKINESDISSELFSKYLYTTDPELIIRPSGEYRLSNFLLWQCAYSEFWFSNVLWPDFNKKHLLQAIADFQKRNRRFGGV